MLDLTIVRMAMNSLPFTLLGTCEEALWCLCMDRFFGGDRVDGGGPDLDRGQSMDRLQESLIYRLKEAFYAYQRREVRVI